MASTFKFIQGQLLMFCNFEEGSVNMQKFDNVYKGHPYGVFVQKLSQRGLNKKTHLCKTIDEAIAVHQRELANYRGIFVSAGVTPNFKRQIKDPIEVNAW